ncbi:MAG: RidA family protein [Planctomycetota bacterium]
MPISPRDNLLAHGIELPPAPKPLALYMPATATDETIYVSGQLPFDNGSLIATGRVGAEVDLETARACARRCAVNALAALDGALERDWRRFRQVLKLTVFVACDPSFTDHHLVADGASELLGTALAGSTRHARAAVGCPSLPMNAPVEVELIAQTIAEFHGSD